MFDDKKFDPAQSPGGGKAEDIFSETDPPARSAVGLNSAEKRTDDPFKVQRDATAVPPFLAVGKEPGREMLSEDAPEKQNVTGPIPPPVIPEGLRVDSPSFNKKRLLIAIVLCLIAGGGAAAWWVYRGKNQTVKPPEENAPSQGNEAVSEENKGTQERNSMETPAQPENQNQETEEVSGTVPEKEVGAFPDLPPDQDADGLTDAEEIIFGTSPLSSDTDGDGLYDREEVRVWKTDPTNPDTDNDGFFDGEEVSRGYDPRGPGRLEELPPPAL